MRYLAILVLLAVSCAGPYRTRFFGPRGEFTPSQPELSDDPLFKTLGPCLAGSVQIHAVDDLGMGVSKGSGVVVTPNRVLTARHMLEGASSWLVKKDGKNYKARSIMSGVGAFDDWALLELESGPLEAVPILDIGGDSNLGYCQAVAVGYSLGWGGVTVTTGHIQSQSPALIRFSAMVAPGNSGGGLFVIKDGRLQLVGIVVALGVSNNQMVYFMGLAVPLSVIRAQGGVR